MTVQINAALSLDQAALEDSAAPDLAHEQAVAFLAAAGQRWQEAGVDRHLLNEVLRGTTVVVTDLPGSQLGMVSGDVLYLDINGAGYGWFLDRTPRFDREFSGSGDELVAGESSPAYGRVDLLTVAMHELGHLMGLAHDDQAGGLMNDELSLSTRRLPTAHDAALLELLYLAEHRQ